MKKRLLLGFFLCSLTGISFSQTTTQKVTISKEISLSNELDAMRSKVEAKQKEVDQSTKSSRAQFSELNKQLQALKDEYLVMLKSALQTTSDASLKVKIEEEIGRISGSTNIKTH